MAEEQYNVYGETDFIDDWMFYSATALQIGNAMLRTFLLNRGLLDYTERDGMTYRMDHINEHQDMVFRAEYVSKMAQELAKNPRFGLAIVSPFAQPENITQIMKRLSCHCLTIYSGSPQRSAKQLLKAINKFRFSPHWLFLQKEGHVASFAIPIRFIVFEIDDYWKGTRQTMDLQNLQIYWLKKVAKILESSYLQDGSYSQRIYFLANQTMEIVLSSLIASARPHVTPMLPPGEDDDEFSCSDSSDYEE